MMIASVVLVLWIEFIGPYRWGSVSAVTVPMINMQTCISEGEKIKARSLEGRRFDYACVDNATRALSGQSRSRKVL